MGRVDDTVISKGVIRQSGCLQVLPYQSNDVLVGAWHELDGRAGLRRCGLVAAVHVHASTVHLGDVDVVCCRQLVGDRTTTGRRHRMLHRRVAQSKFLSGRRCVDDGRRRPVHLAVGWRGQPGDASCFHGTNPGPSSPRLRRCPIIAASQTTETLQKRSTPSNPTKTCGLRRLSCFDSIGWRQKHRKFLSLLICFQVSTLPVSVSSSPSSESFLIIVMGSLKFDTLHFASIIDWWLTG